MGDAASTHAWQEIVSSGVQMGAVGAFRVGHCVSGLFGYERSQGRMGGKQARWRR
jgi:hypothetical protein